ncbi:uncharacterized protein MONOS_10631 [Monocercomonoides exilis]|uniref:uncharacterized protein n=1 Tax=Monocercomonoides exilis TaxID=2049356 RepID=UPI00355A8AEC|nr:hypothetical protein MONOS_10631 [Monocercomonoides exilis]|eukprot:MONOS_10631.1-p1 / transcript=MONOS_10631.1 / gene=MONOS_10631 / organism=Monocercomonoides_exilis_PA203 / gene_product=unspecified product / transcript_product=unspecified product / location=Mono_scaffold00491:16298-18154(+) / protein_length=525 / sequence_SO=supercontig / SO=protein_coding / is_pseudo=false
MFTREYSTLKTAEQYSLLEEEGSSSLTDCKVHLSELPSSLSSHLFSFYHPSSTFDVEQNTSVAFLLKANTTSSSDYSRNSNFPSQYFHEKTFQKNKTRANGTYQFNDLSRNSAFAAPNSMIQTYFRVNETDPSDVKKQEEFKADKNKNEDYNFELFNMRSVVRGVPFEVADPDIITTSIFPRHLSYNFCCDVEYRDFRGTSSNVERVAREMLIERWKAEDEKWLGTFHRVETDGETNREAEQELCPDETVLKEQSEEAERKARRKREVKKQIKEARQFYEVFGVWLKKGWSLGEEEEEEEGKMWEEEERKLMKEEEEEYDEIKDAAEFPEKCEGCESLDGCRRVIEIEGKKEEKEEEEVDDDEDRKNSAVKREKREKREKKGKSEEIKGRGSKGCEEEDNEKGRNEYESSRAGRLTLEEMKLKVLELAEKEGKIRLERRNMVDEKKRGGREGGGRGEEEEENQKEDAFPVRRYKDSETESENERQKEYLKPKNLEFLLSRLEKEQKREEKQTQWNSMTALQSSF